MCINRLIDNQFIKSIEYINKYGKVSYSYELYEKNLSVQLDSFNDLAGIRKHAELKLYFREVLDQGFDSCFNIENNTTMYRQLILRISKNRAEQFKKQLNELLEAFNMEEEEESETTYSILAFLFPNIEN